MKKILVPIDFTDTANNALHFAISLSKTIRSEISIVHILDEKFWQEQDYIHQTIERQAHEKMQQLVAGISPLLSHDTVLAPEVIKGKPDLEIVHRAVSTNADLIIMGTHGHKALIDRMMTSHTVAVSSQSPVPIIVVPEDASFKGILHILFAIDHEPLKIRELEVVNELACNFKSHVYLFHVADPEPILEVPAEIKSVFRDVSYSLHGLPGKDVIQSVNDFCQQNRIDLIVMVRRKRNFLRKLLHDSKTRKEVRKTPVPFLLLAD